MTIRETFEKRLFDNGMFEEDATAVLESFVAAPETETMKGRWLDETEGYPPQMLTVLWVALKRHVVEWIDKNQPKAWYRPVFAG